MKEVCSTLRFTYLRLTPLKLQKSCLEPTSTTPTLTSLEESAWTSWRTTGLLLSKSEVFLCLYNPWWELPTSMILWIAILLTTGREMQMTRSRLQENGLSSTLITSEYLQDQKIHSPPSLQQVMNDRCEAQVQIFVLPVHTLVITKLHWRRRFMEFINTWCTCILYVYVL